jgi:hypothetical protein
MIAKGKDVNILKKFVLYFWSSINETIKNTFDYCGVRRRFMAMEQRL